MASQVCPDFLQDSFLSRRKFKGQEILVEPGKLFSHCTENMPFDAIFSLELFGQQGKLYIKEFLEFEPEPGPCKSVL